MKKTPIWLIGDTEQAISQLNVWYALRNVNISAISFSFDLNWYRISAYVDDGPKMNFSSIPLILYYSRFIW